jgi:hypothetical protein
MAATSPCSSILSSAIVEQYELLRGAALGEALPLRARSGLMLFLRRGMWGWAQTLVTATNPPQEQRHPSPAPWWPTHGAHAAVVHVPATIAMSIHDRRSP